MKLNNVKTQVEKIKKGENKMNKKFDFIVIEPADNNRDKNGNNGNNGNYDKIGVFFDGKLVTTNSMNDWTINRKDYIRTSPDTIYEIKNNRIIFTNFGYEKDITEAVKNGEHPIFRPSFKFLVKEYEELYKKRKKRTKN